MEHRVFIDVDVQRDFCDEAGALRVPGAPNDRFRALTRFAAAQRIPIVGSVDSHAWDAWEFASNDRQGLNGEEKPNFPDHCVKGTPGWLKVEGTLPQRFRFVPNVEAPLGDLVRELARGFTQAVYFEKEVYSLFANPLAESFLAALVAMAPSKPELVVYGVATDYCVKVAALGLVQRGYRTALLTDAIAGITLQGTQAALAEMAAAGVRFTTTESLLGPEAAH